MVIFFNLANEGESIFENYLKLVLPFLEKLRDILAQLKEKIVDRKSRDFEAAQE